MKRSLRCLLLLLPALLPSSLSAGEKAALDADLALVPADAMFFAHVRAADLWKSDYMKDWREPILKVGDKLLTAFDQRFVPRPSSLERVTLFVDKLDKGRELPVVIVTMSAAIDRAAFAKYSLPGVQAVKTALGTFLVDQKSDVEIHFLNDKTIVAGPVGVVRKHLTRPEVPQGNLTAAIQLSQAGKTAVVAFNAQALPPQALAQVPPPFQPLVQAKLAVLTLDVRQEAHLDFHAVYAGAEQAAAAETAARDGIKLARMFLEKARKEGEQKIIGDGKPGTLEQMAEAAAALAGLSMIQRMDEMLATLPLQKEGNALKISVQVPHMGQSTMTTYAIAVALLVPAVQKVREAAARTQSMNNLKQLALAMHIHHEAHRAFPPAAICAKDGKPLLSWRVAILPYIEQNNLYKRFKLDEPWDSEHNRQLIPLMPATFANPLVPQQPGDTNYRVFVGGGAAFEWTKGVRITDFTDGTSNTLLIAESAQNVPWTSPDELVYNPKGPLPRLGNSPTGSTFLAAFVDGSVRTLSTSIAERTLRALITRAGDEMVNPDE
jgi:hypothetical protein